MHRKWIVRLTLLCTAGGVLAGVPLAEDPPTAQAPKPGDVTGRLTPADEIRGLSAVSRVTGKTYRPDRFDRSTGRFAFEDLPGDAAYDLRFDTSDGRHVEGIDLRFVDARLRRLAAERRKELGIPPAGQHDFSPDDVKQIKRYVRELKDFCNVRRALYVKGHGNAATALVELIRDEPFHAEKQDETIWRIELWYFEYRYGGWERVANQERVLERFRGPQSGWTRIHVEYYPKLSVYIDPDGAGEPVIFTLPDEPDPSRGRPSGTAVRLDTETYVLGLDVQPDRPAAGTASRPSEDAAD